ncbi:HEAT repeat domain-containing protein [bacterium]|nr:HEAT repeat domain-containing protein [bacterium]
MTPRIFPLLLLACSMIVSAGEPAAEPDPAANIAKLAKQLGEGQYGSQGACEELIEIGEPAVPALIKALEDKRPQARWWAVAALCRIGADEAYPAVIGVLQNDDSAFVRSTAVYYLRSFRDKGKDIWPDVEKALDDKDGEVGRWALRLMMEDGYPKLDEVLRKVLKTGGSEIRSYAFQHLREMAERNAGQARAYLPLVRELIQAKDERVRYDAVHTVVILLDKGKFQFLNGLWMQDKSPVVQECILRCITLVPEPPVDAFELFILGLESEDEKVRDVAVKLLRKAYKQYFSFDAKGLLPRRNEAIKKWRDWFAANRDRLEWHPDLRKFLLPGQRNRGKGATKK